MIITKKKLHQLIDEEFSRALERRKKLTERFHAGHALYELDSYELLEFARAYADLGDAVQGQLDTILSGDTHDFPTKTNPNAIDMIEDTLSGANQEIDAAVKAYRDWQASWTGEEEEEKEDEEEDDGHPRVRMSFLRK